MGFISNLFKFDRVKKLKGGFAIARYRNSASEALLKDGKILEKIVLDVSNNMIRNADGERVSLFLVKKYNYDKASHYDKNGNFLYKESKNEPDYNYVVYDGQGNKIFDNLNKAANSGLVKRDLVKFDDENDVEQYIIEKDKNFVLMIPQRQFVSEEFKFISEPDEQGRRKVTETDLEARQSGRRNLSYYIDGLGERVSPKFLSEDDAGNYKIFFIPEGNDVAFDYIYDQDFKKVSSGHSFIYYKNGKFFGKDGYFDEYFIDEFGHKLTRAISKKWILNNGVVVVEEEIYRNGATVFDKDYKVVATMKNAIVDEEAGIVAGTMDTEGGKQSLMFGYDTSKKYPVNEFAAKLIVKILREEEVPNAYISSLLRDKLKLGDINTIVNVYEQIVKSNLEIDRNNETLQELSKNAREHFLTKLRDATIDGVRSVRKELKDVDKQRLSLLVDVRYIKKQRDEINKLLNQETAKESE